MDDQLHRILHAFGVCDAADAHRERLTAEAKFADDTFDALLAIPAYLRRSDAGKRALAFHRARKRAADAELQRYTRNPFVALPFVLLVERCNLVEPLAGLAGRGCPIHFARVDQASSTLVAVVVEFAQA
jgi:hypothetical protein